MRSSSRRARSAAINAARASPSIRKAHGHQGQRQSQAYLVAEFLGKRNGFVQLSNGLDRVTAECQRQRLE
jgi:hypothetical protein